MVTCPYKFQCPDYLENIRIGATFCHKIAECCRGYIKFKKEENQLIEDEGLVERIEQLKKDGKS